MANYAHRAITDYDVETLLGPFAPDDTIHRYGPEMRSMAHILYHAGVFKSVGEAKRNGWDKPIKNGFTALTIGKKRLRLCIVHPYDLDDVPYAIHAALDWSDPSMPDDWKSRLTPTNG